MCYCRVLGGGCKPLPSTPLPQSLTATFAIIIPILPFRTAPYAWGSGFRVSAADCGFRVEAVDLTCARMCCLDSPLSQEAHHPVLPTLRSIEDGNLSTHSNCCLLRPQQLQPRPSILREGRGFDYHRFSLYTSILGDT